MANTNNIEGFFASVQSRKRQRDEGTEFDDEERTDSCNLELREFSTVVIVESRLRGEQLVMGGWHLCRVGFLYELVITLPFDYKIVLD
uniref:Uncharacterized protein n=1 Tax=Salix viminalis TaxID=40686 RepID=A0A6N2KSQ1_SALVM